MKLNKILKNTFLVVLACFALTACATKTASTQTLRKQAAWLRKNSKITVVLEGHADERGTREYNLALGERRGNAVKEFLASLGVDPGRLTVISYGKERPAAEGSTSEAWSENRRAVLVVSGN